MRDTDGIINRSALLGRLPPIAKAAMNRASAMPRNDATAPTIEIFDFIGIDMFTGDGVSEKDIARQLKAIGKVPAITVRLNSGGGDVFTGMAILNMLRQSEAAIYVEVLGIAASIASVIAMAGRKVSVADGALMMIHNSSAIVAGQATDLDQMAGVLRKIDAEISSTYASKARRPASTFRDLMQKETWFNAQEAVKIGLADAVLPSDRANHRPPQSALARRLAEMDADRAEDMVLAARRKVAAYR